MCYEDCKNFQWLDIDDPNNAYEVECWCTKYHCECLKWQKEQAKQQPDLYDDIDFDNDPDWICTDHKVEVKQLTINFELWTS